MPALTQAQRRRARTGATPPRRKSPGNRSPEGQFGLYDIEPGTKRAGFFYKWGYSGDLHSMADAVAKGYTEVKWEFQRSGKKLQFHKTTGRIKVSGPCPCGAAPQESDEGKPIRVGDSILLVVSNQRRADIEEWGADGTSGQAGVDLIEERITDRSRGKDALRGMQGINNAGRHHMSSDTWDDGSMRHGETERL